MIGVVDWNSGKFENPGEKSPLFNGGTITSEFDPNEQSKYHQKGHYGIDWRVR